ncbi:peptidoglycan-binding protein [Streptomyces shenzhenensis]|uniref:peptidoglycan-binding protein n=1 Tax=Streptomyces shenzhenensis TaxID=943815 RepID=UPI001F3C0BFC|nr:peptidoglycan-binding protein [Streptomyces shenzhenensis]
MTSQEEGTVERVSAQEAADAGGGELEPRAETLPSFDGSGGGGAVEPAAEPAPRGRRRGMRTALIAACAVVIAAAAVGAASGAFGGGGGQADASAPTGPPATAKVQRTTLTSSQTMDGQLGYGDTSAVQAPSSGASGSSQSGQSAQGGGSASAAGIVTWMPSDGDTITRGKPVYKVNQQSVPLLYGSVPLYRTLSPGSSGSDVKMLEQNLRALGYKGFTVDSTYDSDTAAAVEKWQGDLGRTETGEVKVGDAVVASGARRVAKAGLAIGDTLAGSVLTWTGTDRVISVDLPVQYADLAKKGGESTVTLPDNSTVTAVVTDIGTPTSSGNASGSGSSDSGGSSGSAGSGSSNATLPVELKVKDTKKLGSYQAAAVSVEFASGVRSNVLAVPISALYALPHGGYAVEVVTGTKTEYRKVTLGMFGNGMVEVSGTGITAGTVVGVPK